MRFGERVYRRKEVGRARAPNHSLSHWGYLSALASAFSRMKTDAADERRVLACHAGANTDARPPSLPGRGNSAPDLPHGRVKTCGLCLLSRPPPDSTKATLSSGTASSLHQPSIQARAYSLQDECIRSLTRQRGGSALVG